MITGSVTNEMQAGAVIVHGLAPVPMTGNARRPCTAIPHLWARTWVCDARCMRMISVRAMVEPTLSIQDVKIGAQAYGGDRL